MGRLHAVVALLVVVCGLGLARAARAATYSGVIAADSPAGYWRFAESSGTTVADASGNGVTGTYANGVTLAQPGALPVDGDTAAALDGADDVVTFGDRFDFAGNAAFSFEAWVKPSLVPSSTVRVASKESRDLSAHDGWDVNMSSTYGFCLERWRSAAHVGACGMAGKLIAGRWYHVVATYDSATSRIYVNGQLVGARADAAALRDDAGGFQIGNIPWGGLALSGVVDEPAVYDHELSGAQIQSHYETGLDGLGSRPFHSFESFQPTDRIALQVDVANGNLLVQQTDLVQHSRGLDVGIARFYNGLSSSNTDLGVGWTFSTGTDLHLAQRADGDAVYRAPSGYLVAFERNADGSYASPDGLNARLERSTSDGSYTLTYNGSGTQVHFNSVGVITSIEDKHDNRIGFDSNSDAIWTAAYDSQGRKITVTPNASEHVTAITDSAARKLQYGYAGETLTSYTDAAGGITRYGYDADSRLTKLTQPSGKYTSIAYDDKGRVSSVVEVTNLAAGTGPTTSFSYDSSPSACGGGRGTVVTDPLGHATTYCIDATGTDAAAPQRVGDVFDALGHERSRSYDSNGNVVTYTTPGNGTGTSTYESTWNGWNLTQQTSPSGFFSTFEYADTSHPFYATRFTDPQGNSLSFSYTADSAGDLSSISDRNGAEKVHVTWNSNGTIASVKDAKGTTAYGYNADGELTSVDYPGSLGSWSYTWDSLSRLKTVTDGKSQTTTYGYDALDRLKTIAYQGGATVTYSYDADDKMRARGDSAGTWSFGYDELNRLTSESVPGHGTIGYVYDDTGNLLAVQDANGTVSYGYNPVNLVTSVLEPGAVNAISFSYNDDNARTQTSYPNGVVVSEGFDSAARVTSIVAHDGGGVGTTLQDLSYCYSNPCSGGVDTALRQSATDNLAGVTTTYSYDLLERLTGAAVGSTSYGYAYDGNGNITSRTVGGQTTSFSYADGSAGAQSNLLTAVDGVSLSYDGNGNLTASPEFSSLSYTSADQTSQITPAGGSAVSFTYGSPGQGARLSAGSTSFEPTVLGVLQAGAFAVTRDNRGTLVSLRTAGGSYYPLFDALGSVVALTDGSGGVVASYSYDPYGRSLSVTDSLGNPFRFAGLSNYVFDSQTGLYKVGQRYYDPELGRWTQQDPIQNPFDTKEWNRYVYAGDDPINQIDPSGLGIFGSIGDFLTHDIPCTFRSHPVLAGVGTAVLAGGLALTGFGIGVEAGILFGAESTFGGSFAAFATELGVEEAGHVLIGGGVLGLFAGGASLTKGHSGC